MKINVKSKGTQPTCQMPFVLSCEHWFISAIQKLVIKDVVQFTDRKLDTYKSIVPKDALGYLHAEQNPLMAADGNSSDDLFLID